MTEAEFVRQLLLKTEDALVCVMPPYSTIDGFVGWLVKWAARDRRDQERLAALEAALEAEG